MKQRDGYKWVALSNTTLAVFMSALDGSIVIISLPAIFRGISQPRINKRCHQGLVLVFGVAAALSVLAALASLLRGDRYLHR